MLEALRSDASKSPSPWRRQNRNLTKTQTSPTCGGGVAALTSRRARARVGSRAGVSLLRGAVKRGRSWSLVSPELYSLRPLLSHSPSPTWGPQDPGQLLWLLNCFFRVLLSAEPLGAHEVRRQLRDSCGVPFCAGLGARRPPASPLSALVSFRGGLGGPSFPVGSAWFSREGASWCQDS